MQGVFNPNILIYHPLNSAEGLHFSAFHFLVCVCLCVCVCLSVRLPEHAILAVRAIRNITKDAIVLSVGFAAILKRRFS